MNHYPEWTCCWQETFSTKTKSSSDLDSLFVPHWVVTQVFDNYSKFDWNREISGRKVTRMDTPWFPDSYAYEENVQNDTHLFSGSLRFFLEYVLVTTWLKRHQRNKCQSLIRHIQSRKTMSVFFIGHFWFLACTKSGYISIMAFNRGHNHFWNENSISRRSENRGELVPTGGKFDGPAGIGWSWSPKLVAVCMLNTLPGPLYNNHGVHIPYTRGRR